VDTRRLPEQASITRRALLRGAALAAAGAAAACAAPQAAAPAKPAGDALSAPGAAPATSPLPAAPTVAREPDVVHQGNVGTAFSTTIAHERGYFKDLAIDLQDEPYQTGAQMTPLLAAGQLDVGTTSMQSAFFNAVNRGIEQRMVVDKGHQQKGTATSVLAVRADLVPAGGTLPLAEIKGRQIAVTTDPKAGGQGFLLVKMLASVGLTMDDLDWKTIPYRDMPDLMANRQVDGAVFVEPFYTLSAQRAPLVMWQNLSDYYDGQQTAAYVFGEQFHQGRPDVARRWMVANLRGVRDYNDWQRRGQPADEIADILARATGLSVDVVQQVQWEHMNPDGYLNVPGIEADQRQLLEWGAIERLVPMDHVVDHQFVDYALAQLGKYAG
jgi:NitT/TauT family transport system substrate-binding protein